MAIDKNKTKELLSTIKNLMDSLLPDNLSAETKNDILKKIFGPAVDEIIKLIDESRPPVIFLMGRSGHGKSSIINALANKKVADTSSVKPGTMGTTKYDIDFEDTHSKWTIYDSRGYFETSKFGMDNIDDSKILLKSSIIECKPDIILHVISMPEVRNLENDIKLFKEISTELHKENGALTPTLIVLNNSDLPGDPQEWPPENNPFKSGLIKKEIEYLTIDVLRINKFEPLSKNDLYGLKYIDDTYLGTIPVCAHWEDIDERWNIETLVDYIGEKLPKEAQLFFSQALKRKKLLQKISDSLIKKFTSFASLVGSNPIPFGDIYILTPLQILLTTIIAALSCRNINVNNYEEILKEMSIATGIIIGGAMGLRELARFVLDISGVGIPVAAGISGAIAGAGTYTIGKLSQAYFFNEEIKDPKELFDEGKNFLRN